MGESDEIVIEQALFARNAIGVSRVVARSAGFGDDWLPGAERLCTEFGERPAGVACSGCLLARPFGDLVAVVQVKDVGPSHPAEPMLHFRLLIIPLVAYRKWIGNPFAIADRLPPSWHARGELPTLTWPAESLPRREVGEIQRILQRASSVDGTPLSPVLLGATQALVDGGRVVFERRAPDTELVRDLWNLLPHSTRNRLWPASFAFAPAFDFDVVVVPRADDVRYAGYLTEEQAANYPQGRYELRLQLAAEAGDQQDVDALFTRRSRAEMFRFGFILLIGMLVLLGVSKVLQQLIR